MQRFPRAGVIESSSSKPARGFHLFRDGIQPQSPQRSRHKIFPSYLSTTQYFRAGGVILYGQAYAHGCRLGIPLCSENRRSMGIITESRWSTVRGSWWLSAAVSTIGESWGSRMHAGAPDGLYVAISAACVSRRSTWPRRYALAAGRHCPGRRAPEEATKGRPKVLEILHLLTGKHRPLAAAIRPK